LIWNFLQQDLGGQKYRDVINVWRSLFGEYHNVPADGSSNDTYRAWNVRIDDRLVFLLLAMSKAVGYDFSEEQLRRGIYYPKGRWDLEQTQLAILRGLQKVLEGTTALPMKITEIPTSHELIKAQLSTMEKSAAAYDEDGAMRVRIVETEKSR